MNVNKRTFTIISSMIFLFILIGYFSFAFSLPSVYHLVDQLYIKIGNNYYSILDYLKFQKDRVVVNKQLDMSGNNITNVESVNTSQLCIGNDCKASWSQIEGLDSIIFGSGSDGDVIISTDTTLTRDMEYNSLTVKPGVVLNTNGYRIRVKETAIIDGIIQNNGADASGWGGGQGAPSGTLRGGGAGGRGQTCNKNSNAGETVYYSKGGKGGGGGSAYSPADCLVSIGRPGGKATPTGAAFKSLYDFISLVAGPNGELVGGGAGGGGGGNYVGGGGGGGGGVIYIAARTLIGSGTIEARGGNGADAPTGFNIEAGGGGGGGGGGVIILVYKQKSFTGILDVSGGLGGKGIGGGTNGAPGEDGSILEFQVP